MTLKQKETNQYSQYGIDRIKRDFGSLEAANTSESVQIDLERLVSDANKAESFKELFSSLDFKRTNSRFTVKGEGISLFKSKQNTWLIKFFKDSLDAMSIFKAVEYVHGLQSKGNRDNLLEVCEILCDISGNHIDSYITKGEYSRTYSPKPRTRTTKTAPTAPYVPNTGAIKKTSTFTFATNKSGAAVGALEYMRNKINAPNATIQELQKLGVYFIESKTTKATKKNKKTYTFKSTKDNPIIAFCTNPSKPRQGSIKAKQPNTKNKDYKTTYIQSQSNYIFGYQNLPEDHKEIKAILICGGESDTTAINYHFNQFGVFAICLSGETTTIRAGLLADLRKRTPNVFTLFDNDKDKINKITGLPHNTGVEARTKAAINVGIPFVKIELFTEQNDICDTLQAHNKYDLYEFLTREMFTKTAIKKLDSRFSIAIPEAYKIDIGESYFDDETHLNNYGFDNIGKVTAVQILVEILVKENKLLLSGACGIGKSTMIQMLLNHLSILKLKRIIFVVPTQNIAKQQQLSYERKGLLAPVIMEGSNKEDFLDAENSKLIICVYNSLGKIGYLVDEGCLLIGDEMHLLSGEIRQDVGNAFLQYTNFAAKTLLMSATVDPIFTTDLSPLLNYKLLKVINKSTQIINYQPLRYTGGVEADIFKYIYSQKTNQNATTLVKKNNVKMLEAWDKQVKALGGNSDINTSKKPEYKEDNKNYNSIINDSLLFEMLQFFFFTSLLDTGVSFNFLVDIINLINLRCATTVAQAVSRPRHDKKTGVNKEFTVYNFLTANRKNKSTFDNRTTVEAVSESIETAKEAAVFANNFKGKAALKKIYDDALIYWEDLEGAYVPNILKIIGNEQKRKNSLSTKSEFEQELQAFSPNINILPEIEINLSEDLEVKQELQESKKELKALKDDTFEILGDATANNSIDAIFEAYYHKSTHIVKNRIKEVTHVSRDITPEGKAITEKYKTHFEENAFDTVMARYFQVKDVLDKEASEIGTNKPTYKKIVKTILDNKKGSNFKEFINSKITEIELVKDELSGVEALRVLNYQNIDSNVKRAKERFKKQVQRGVRDNCLFSKFDIINCITGSKKQLDNKYLFELEAMTGIKKDHKKELLAIKELFTVKTKTIKIELNGKLSKRNFYEIGKLKRGVSKGIKRDVLSQKTRGQKGEFSDQKSKGPKKEVNALVTS